MRSEEDVTPFEINDEHKCCNCMLPGRGGTEIMVSLVRLSSVAFIKGEVQSVLS